MPVSAETITYAHDKIGSLTVANSTTNANDWAWAYDPYGRMSCAKPAATACSSGTTRVLPSYDAFDRTASQTSSGTTTTFAWRGIEETLTYRKLGTGSPTAYVASAGGSPIAEKQTNAYFYLRTPHGDVMASVTTAAASNSTTTFDPYGKPLATSGTQPALGYQGDLTDPNTKLVDMGTRYYMPTTGRFTTRDVLVGDPTAPMSLNRFAYAYMNPIRFIDSTGMPGCEGSDPDGPKCGTTIENDDGTTTKSYPSGASTTTDGSGHVVSSTSAEPVPVPEPDVPVINPVVHLAAQIANQVSSGIGTYMDARQYEADYIQGFLNSTGFGADDAKWLWLIKAHDLRVPAALRWGARGAGWALAAVSVKLTYDGARHGGYSTGESAAIAGGGWVGGTWGAGAGALLALACGPAAIFCSPALAILGGVGGGVGGEAYMKSMINHAGVYSEDFEYWYWNFTLYSALGG